MRAAACVLASLLWPLIALGQDGQVQAYIDASAKFEGLLKDYAAVGAEPSVERLSPLVAQLTDEGVFFEARSTADPLRSLLDVCGAANRANVSLALFGLTNAGIKTKEPSEVAVEVVRLMERNTLKFQEVALPLTTFLTSCFAIQQPYMVKFSESLSSEQLTPERLAGIRQSRNGIEEFLIGAISSIADPRLDERLRFKLAEALALRISAYAESVPKERRSAIQRTARLVLDRVPIRFRLDVRRVIDAMNSDQCNFVDADRNLTHLRG